MKKAIALMLVLIFSVMVFAACRITKKAENLISDANKAFESNTGTSVVVSEPPNEPIGNLKTVVDDIYNIKRPDFQVETKDVDITNKDTLKTYTGLNSSDKIKEAIVSESTTGTHAYSLVLVRVRDEADLKEVAQAMKNGINQKKSSSFETSGFETSRIEASGAESSGVNVNDIRVVGKQDVIMLIMMSPEYSDKLTVNQIADAFKSLYGNNLTIDLK